ncbi:hypothetical protein B0H99_101368 [Planomicrobium soli]|uniref:Uncharacterized protein n=1 Tax=Planomicrobium soli TaxID=1176648 RepID=A0A2P8H7F4_9BACL|nr:hypothetical protein [Planomicrobium soli]PSL42120.1 hypothetical protein B0H99_101368 [Planomicrobium soli]
MNPEQNNEMTLEQAKETLKFQVEVMQQQTAEIGALTSEKITLVVQDRRNQAKIKELKDALQGMVDATKAQESAE